MSLPRPLVIPRIRLQDLDDAARLEWLEADGRGGYASSTAAGANTRRYHGLLVVARRPPTDRIVLLSRLEESVITAAGERFDLSVNYYPGVVHPAGHRHLETFRLDPWPIWEYRLGDHRLTRSLFMARGGAVVLAYRIVGGSATLELRPLVAGRDFHSLVRENDAVEPAAHAADGRLSYRPYPGIPPLVLSHDPAAWQAAPTWYRATVYPREADRGLDDREDLFSPGTLVAALSPARPWRLVCGTRPVELELCVAWEDAERRRRTRAAARGRALAGAGSRLDGLAAHLGMAAESFLVDRDDGRSILAGYPWFGDWGRDAMIAIPGLCLAMGRIEDAVAVLRTFAAHLRDGLIPNRFPDHGGPVPDDHYNAADAPLWFIEAAAALVEAGGNARELWPTIRAIIHAYAAGTRFGIGLDADGLVRQGEPAVQLTWMDARVNGWVVTPRHGKAVEINALWYNATCRAAALARETGEDAAPYKRLARRTRAAFPAFWYDAGGYLYDLIGDDGRPDPALRPNQLFALSLPHPLLDGDCARSVVDAVARELLVPLGVRTLAPRDPEYVGTYAGGRRERDAAYHRGTAWPWLLGPFCTAFLRAYGDDSAALDRVRSLLAAFEPHLAEYGLGQIAEVVGGDPPHPPAGCFAQAWSCSELLRVIRLLRDATASR